MLKKQFLLLSMMKPVVLLNIFLKIFDSVEKKTIYLKQKSYYNKCIFIVTFDQFNASLLNKSPNNSNNERKILLTINFWMVVYMQTEIRIMGKI